MLHDSRKMENDFHGKKYIITGVGAGQELYVLISTKNERKN